MSIDTQPARSSAPVALASTRQNAAVIAAITSHHAQLAEDLRALGEQVLLTSQGGDFRPTRARLVEWYRSELLPHAQAEERALYARGADLETTRLLVRGMISEHRALAEAIDAIEAAATPVEVGAATAAGHALFTVHLGKENDLLLPALDAAGVDLAAALEGMHEILGAGEQARASGSAGGCGCGHDHAGPSHAGDEAKDGSAANAEETGDLDVRSLPHGARHEIIFGKLNSLPRGATLVIANDHDPKPLRYQTEAMWPGKFTWTYLEAGPALWRVAIERVR